MGSPRKSKVRLIKIIQAFFYVAGILFCMASIVGLVIGAETVAWIVVEFFMGVGFVAVAIIKGDQIISKIKSNNEQTFQEKNTFFQLKLLSPGEDQLYLVKIIKEELGLVLKEAADVVRTIPCILPQKYTREEAEQLGAKISRAGARYQIVPIEDKHTN